MKKYFLLWLAFSLVTVLWLFNGFIYPLLVPSLDARAANGDAFGAVNALFSGLAFAGLIYTILMQREELALQREELRLQREQMAETKEEIAKQADMQEAQVKAMISQIHVSSFQAEILVLEFEAKDSHTTQARHEKVAQIRKISSAINQKGRDLVEEFFPLDIGKTPSERWIEKNENKST